MTAEDAGEPLDDGEVEFEDEEVDEEVYAEPAPPTNLSNNPPLTSRRDKKYAKLRKRSRAKRAAEAVERVASRGVKPFVVELAKGALPLELEDFDASTLPVSSSGWNANPRKKLSPGLQRVWKNLEALSTLSGLKLLRWDGQACIVLIDAHDRIIAVLGGVPHGSKGKEWQAVEAEATAAAMHCREASTFTEAQKHGRRGDFASRTVGYGYGNGRCKPQNYKVSGTANQNAMQELLRNQAIRRISGFQNALFNTFCHKNYAEYRDTNDEIQLKQPELRANFPNTAFAATTFNLGPLSFSPPHMDPDNRASSWCADTNMGPFDPDKGGHLVLWDLGLIIRFPPGSTILFPSALITHSTIPIQAHETRYAMIQYSSGGLFRWRNNGFQSDKSFLERATAEEHAEWEASRVSRWRLGLQKFTRWGDICRGDWRGTARTAAGLDEVSDLSDLEESPETLRPSKRARRQ
ncbi:hypothetical protein C8R41DRAFT_788018 [Lentinula lateritia]|uniref:Uncharacterized protein n=1 Tax=Lentinula lateritia TaxID=40482 RepID=A0ABQ8VUC5_9AGAR|nr:hypothetical protein C8R41DRAFT_788018 [Lentinula lateritia]